MGYVSASFSHRGHASLPVSLLQIWEKDTGSFKDGDRGLMLNMVGRGREVGGGEWVG